MPEPDPRWDDPTLDHAWVQIRRLRGLGPGRSRRDAEAKQIGSGQEAILTIHTDADGASRIDRGLLTTVCMVSEVHVVADRPGRSPGRGDGHGRQVGLLKCERCWNFRPTVGQSSEHPTLCDRCVRVLAEVESALSTVSSPPIRLAVCVSGGGTTLAEPGRTGSPSGSFRAEVVQVIASRARDRRDRPGRGGGLAGRGRGPLGRSVAEHSAAIFDRIRAAGADLVILGGFLSLLEIPDDYRGRVINVHPSLIPAFSGQGFHGLHVHQAAIEWGVKLSGCTVHFVDATYDTGPIIFQVPVPVLATDTPRASPPASSRPSARHCPRRSACSPRASSGSRGGGCSSCRDRRSGQRDVLELELQRDRDDLARGLVDERVVAGLAGGVDEQILEADPGVLGPGVVVAAVLLEARPVRLSGATSGC